MKISHICEGEQLNLILRETYLLRRLLNSEDSLLSLLSSFDGGFSLIFTGDIVSVVSTFFFRLFKVIHSPYRKYQTYYFALFLS